MDFSFNEDQTAIRDLAAQIFNDRVTDEYHRARSDSGFDRELWQILAQSGLTGLNVPEQYGGSGMGFIELCLLLEEQGRTLAPLPLLASLLQGALPVCEFASQRLQASLLPGLVEGTGHLSAALSEANRGPLATPLRVKRTAAGWELSGDVSQIPYADSAMGIVLSALDEQQRTLVLVLEPEHSDVKFIAQQCSNGEPQFYCQLNNVVVPEDALLGTPDTGNQVLEWILQRSYTGLAALILGVVSETLKRAAAYTMERKQFGRLIASFQAVSHRAANGFIDIEALRSSYWQAMWLLHQGRDASCEALAAKWWACEAGHRIAHTGQHLHGGIGADLEFPVHRYFLWAKQLEFTLGGAQQSLGGLGLLLATNANVGGFLSAE